jgi:hypothetical protein
MEKLGMERCNPAFFDHPNVADPGFRQHVLYKKRLSTANRLSV